MKKFIHRPQTLFFAALFLALSLLAFEEYLFEQPHTKALVLAQEAGLAIYLLWLFSLVAGLLLNIYWFWWSLRAKTPWRILYGLLFVVAVLIQYGYWKFLHRLVEPTDIALLGLTTTQAWAAGYQLYFSWQGLLVCLPYLSGLVVWRKLRQTGWREFVFSLLAVFALGLVLMWFNLSANLGASFTDLLQSLAVYVVSDVQPPVRESVSALEVSPPLLNIVLIIDEGIRADHLTVNDYERETTPWLTELQQQGNFYSWGIASAGGTCSPISNQLLLTGLIPSVQAVQAARKTPTVFQYALAAGYKAYYFDAQANYLWNGLSPTDLEGIEWVNTEVLGQTPAADLNAARLIHEIVSHSTGNFILLNKRGVHFMYEDSYPVSAEIWSPLPPNQDYRGFPELVANPYDNGVRYTVDGFFRVLLPDTATYSNTWYIYTSDHAQTLFEDGMTWSHCNNSLKEASVPLIIAGNFSEPPDTSLPASHSHLLATILDLMDFPTSQVLQPLNVSLLAHDNLIQPRFFIDGAARLTPFDPAP